ncbi:hypothetical protein MMC28_007986 [Mycoblastus sanguinarius]|nr:hypothetical protein [Mycoblastus sanguinarius]
MAAFLSTATEDSKKLLVHSVKKEAKALLIPSIEHVLHYENSFVTLECRYMNSQLPGSRHFPHLALEIFNRCCPLLSRLVFDLDLDYPSDESILRDNFLCVDSCAMSADPSRFDHIVCALRRFPRLTHLKLLVKLDMPQVELMSPEKWKKAVRALFGLIQLCKRGSLLLDLELVFVTWTSYLFGPLIDLWHTDLSATQQVTMSCHLDDRLDRNGDHVLGCDNPIYGTLIKRRTKAEMLGGSAVWDLYLGPYFWEYQQSKWSLPTAKQLEWIIRTSIPSKLSFIAQKGEKYT